MERRGMNKNKKLACYFVTFTRYIVGICRESACSAFITWLAGIWTGWITRINYEGNTLKGCSAPDAGFVYRV